MTIEKPKHPGHLVREMLKSHKMTQSAFSKRVGISESKVSQVISGVNKLNPQFALALEAVFQTEACYWVRLQADYDLALTRKVKRAS